MVTTTRVDSATARSDASSELSACSSGSVGERRVDLRQPGAHRLELGLVAPGQRPAQPDGCVLGEVGRGQLAGEAGGSEDDDVVVAGVSVERAQVLLGGTGRLPPFSPIGDRAEPGRPTLRHTPMDTPAKAALGGGLISTLGDRRHGGGGRARDLGGAGAHRSRRPRPPVRPGWCPFEDCDALRSWYVDHTARPGRSVGLGRPDVADDALEDTMAREPTTAGRPGQRGGERGDRHQHPGGRRRRARRRQDRRADRRTRAGRAAPGHHRRHRQRAAELADWAAAARRRTPTDCCSSATTCSCGSWHQVMGREGSMSPQSAAHRGLRRRHLRPHRTPGSTHTGSWSGRQLSMRQYGDTVRLVTSIGLPTLPFVQPRPATSARAEAERRNREIVRSIAHRGLDPRARLRRGLPPGPVDRRGHGRRHHVPARCARRRHQGGRHRERAARCTPRPTGST